MSIGRVATRVVGQPRGGNPDPTKTKITGIHGPPIGKGWRRHGVPGGPGSTLVLDTFTDTIFTPIASHTPDTDTVGSGWVVYESAGNPQCILDRLVGSAGLAVVAIDTGNADGTLTCDIIFPGAGKMEGGLVARLTDASNYFYSEIQDSTLTNPVLELFEMVAGTPTSRDTVTMTGEGPMQSTVPTMTMTCSGDDVSVSMFAGAYVATYNTTTGNTKTEFGAHFSNAQAQHDDFEFVG